MEALIPIIIQAISGAVGGGIVGSVVKQAAMGLLPRRAVATGRAAIDGLSKNEVPDPADVPVS